MSVIECLLSTCRQHDLFGILSISLRFKIAFFTSKIHNQLKKIEALPPYSKMKVGATVLHKLPNTINFKIDFRNLFKTIHFWRVVPPPNWRVGEKHLSEC